MIPGIPRPCLGCGKLIYEKNRCPECRGLLQQKIDQARGPRPHYGGTYKRRAKQIRETAKQCWICGEGPRSNDPFQADHYYPGDKDSPLLAAHRSCNIRRGNTPPHNP
jgi:hypothetical protein